MQRRDTNHIIIKLIGDIAVTFGSVLIAFWLRTQLPFGLTYTPSDSDRLFLLAAVSLYPLVYFMFSLYDPRRTFRAVDEYQILTIGSIVAGLALAGFVFFFQRGLSRLLCFYFFVVQFVLICFWQAAVRTGLKSRSGANATIHRTLLIGGGTIAREVIDRLRAVHWESAQLVGYLTDGDPIPTANGELRQLGTLSDIERVIARYRIDDVLLALPSESYAEIERLSSRLVDKPCNVWVVPDYFNMMLYGSQVDELGGVPMISLKAPTITGYQRIVKRLFDLVLGGLLSLVAFPIMAVIAVAIKLDSPGSVFFLQSRVGENQRLFSMYKFRSMVTDAENRQHEVLRKDEDGNLIHKAKDDPRVTRVGHIIRRTSLDELPQLINVLKGDMSLVGPRPELPLLVERYQPWQRQRFAVPQGMTGWWQVNGRSDRPMHLHTEDDLYYVRNYSLLLDFRILLKTVWVVLRGRGAY